MATRKKGLGRGWHGDSVGHAQAGRKGGLASRRKRKGSSNDDQGQGQMSM